MAFQARQGKQIGQQIQHALAFFLHQADKLLLLLGGQGGHIGHGFQKAVNHRERGAQFVGYIGHKGGAGGVELLGGADVLGNQQFGAGFKSGAGERQHAVALFAAGHADFDAARRGFQRLLQKLVEFGHAQQIGQNAHPIAFDIQI